MTKKELHKLLSRGGVVTALPKDISREAFLGKDKVEAGYLLGYATITGSFRTDARRSLFDNIRFKDCLFDGVWFDGAVFRNCGFQNVVFHGAIMKCAVFTGCFFENTTADYCDVDDLCVVPSCDGAIVTNECSGKPLFLGRDLGG